jgi:hypothetical protein
MSQIKLLPPTQSLTSPSTSNINYTNTTTKVSQSLFSPSNRAGRTSIPAYRNILRQAEREVLTTPSKNILEMEKMADTITFTPPGH